MHPSEIQESQYHMPYHYLPWSEKGVWGVSRSLWWGYEYLALLHTVMDLIERRVVSKWSSFQLLDFGCGDGRLIVELLNRYPSAGTIIGVDISERALAYARAATWGEYRVRFFTTVKDVIDAGLLVHVVTAVEVLEHISPQELSSTIEDIHKVLIDGGRFIVSVPTTNIPLNRKHYQHFTLSSLRQLIGSLFEIEEIRYVHRVGAVANIVRKAIINRFFIANNPFWLKICTLLYKKFVMQADENTGAHLVCSLRKA